MAQLVIQPDGAAGVDTHLLSLVPGANFAVDTVLRAGTDNWGKGGVSRCRPLLRFDLTAIPANATIESAALTMYHANSTLPAGGTFYLYRVTQTAWTEFGATWDTFDGLEEWQTAGGDFTATDGDSSVVPDSSSDLIFSMLKPLVDDALALRLGQLHAIIIGPETGSVDNYFEGKSSDHADAGARPRLVVNYTPPPQLAIVDHGDNTGATAAIGQTAGSATNVVYVQGFSGDPGSGAWQSAGARVGDGELVLQLPTGHYFAYVASSDGAKKTASSVNYFVVTDGLESLHTRCLAAAQARIRSLALAGLDNERVLVRKVPLDRHLAGSGGIGLPAIVLSPRRAAMPPTAGTNGLDDVHYDVLVAIFDRDNQESSLALNLERHMQWRELIARAFRNQRLSGVPQIINAEVESAEGLIEEAWKHELMVSALLVRFTSREPRGFN
jgi:hypothetical protein